MSAPKTPPLTLIVAATVKNGIGKNGTLPWPMLKKEMAYFARVTKRILPSSSSPSDPAETNSTTSPPPQNVVVMGRKTWDSIPPRFRPLPNRTNLVISRQSSIASISPSHLASGNVVVASSITSGLASLASGVGTQTERYPPIGRVFVIGGGAIYRAALEMEETRHVLLTRVEGEWECDTEFEDLEASPQWERRDTEALKRFTGEEGFEGEEGARMEEVVGGEKTEFEFQLWERK